MELPESQYIKKNLPEFHLEELAPLVATSGGATPGPAGARAPAGNAVPRLVPRLEKFWYFKFLTL
jgi:hypothetical protein